MMEKLFLQGALSLVDTRWLKTVTLATFTLDSWSSYKYIARARCRRVRRSEEAPVVGFVVARAKSNPYR